MDKWDSIPKDLQDIIQKSALESQKKQLQNRQASDNAAEKAMAAAGVKINDISQKERDRMKNACQPIYDKYEKNYKLGGLIKKMLSLNS